jgi:hypothetical protein
MGSRWEGVLHGKHNQYEAQKCFKFGTGKVVCWQLLKEIIADFELAGWLCSYRHPCRSMMERMMTQRKVLLGKRHRENVVQVKNQYISIYKYESTKEHAETKKKGAGKV